MRGSTFPDGVVTFLMTDIEGSTRLWEERPEAMSAALERHDAVIEEIVATHSGILIRNKGEGDSTFSVFESAIGAVSAAVEIQRSMADDAAMHEVPLRVRGAVHTGEAELRNGDYFGLVPSRCARLRTVASGGQTLCSHTTQASVIDELPEAITLRDLGLHRLRDLARAERVYQVCHHDLPETFPVLRSLDVRHNLPIQRTSFVGRGAETLVVGELLGDGRLVTLVGIGGCGKTRLAVEVASQQLQHFPDGVFFVDLSPVGDGGLVAGTIATSVGSSRPAIGTSQGGPIDELLDFLSSREILLVLDNCEHLVSACAELANEILRTCPDVRILATSREALAIAGERMYTVPPLAGPADDLPELADSVRLFYERATLVRPEFSLSSDSTRDIAEICGRLDGLPLAIELAAAQIAYLSPRQIVDHLDDRFALLTGGPRHSRRQQTLRAAIDWSYDFLDEAQRTVLRRVSVFPGSFSLDAAQAACGDESVVGVVQLLVAKSLVVTESEGASFRYRLLESVRVYADERLAEAGDVETTRNRHRDYFLTWAEAVPDERTFLDPDGVIQLEQHNLRAALRWSEEQGRLDLVGRIASTMNRIWLADVPEGRRWLALGLEAVDELGDEERVRVLALAAQVAVTAIEAADGVLAERAVEASGGRPGMWSSLAHGLLCLSRGVQTLRGNPTRAADVEPLGARALELAPGPMSRGLASFWLGQARVLLGNIDGAITELERAAVEVIPGGDMAPVAQALLAGLWHVKEEHERARVAAEKAREYTVSTPSQGLWAWVLYDSLPYALEIGVAGRHEDAIEFLRELLEEGGTTKGAGLRGAVVVTLAALAVQRGDDERACILLGNAWHAIFTEGVRTPVDVALFGHYDAKIRSLLDAETVQRLFERGESMSGDDAIAYGLEM